jgi:glycosyltransferase involved in cell wall biosynthesis|tara:strand:- start:1065 stop:2171 length:1107 start_codon:yes stop_codon:yes gene_type:complete
VTINLVYLVSHPIQYQAPLLRNIAADSEFDLQVLFESDFSAGNYRDDGFAVDVRWDVPLRSGYSNALVHEVDLAVTIGEADVIWVHGWQSAALRRVVDLARAAGTPVLMRGENWFGAMPDGGVPKKWAKRFYLGRHFEKCSAFLSIGSKNREYYLDYGISDKLLFSMPYAIDNDYFTSRATEAAANEVRQHHGIEEGRKIILYAGKMSRRKHPELLLAAWDRMSDGVDNAPILLFVGDGEMRAELEQRAPQGVIFAGFKNQSEMPAYYGVADLFVLMAEREPWGLAVNEAMACGTGVIVSDEVGAAYDLVDDRTGVRLPVGDADALSAALASSLDHSEHLGHAAAEKIQDWGFDADIEGLKAAVASVL